MSDDILDYSTIGHQDAYHQDPMNWGGGGNLEAFFSQVAYCPFCRKQAEVTFHDGAYSLRDTPNDDVHISTQVFACGCGWWDMVTRELEHGRWEYAEDAWYFRRVPILRRFLVGALDLPIDVLRAELAKRPSLLDKIRTPKFEEFVGSVLAEHVLKCTVHHCGRSHDGGIDLFTVDCDKPFAIQVKRRVNLTVAESVSCVREFVGAMVGNGYMRGLFVTTRRFSREAMDYADDVLERKAVEELVLMDGGMLRSLFKLTVQVGQKPSWWPHLPETLRAAASLSTDERRRLGIHGAFSSSSIKLGA